jgi:hypothetical protein
VNKQLSSASPIVVGLAAVVASTGLLLAGMQVSSAAVEPIREVNPMEHAAHRYLAEAQQEQERVLNRREHLAQRDVINGAAGSISGGADPCSLRLARAWRALGHFSDGYETYLLHHSPVCS